MLGDDFPVQTLPPFFPPFSLGEERGVADSVHTGEGPEDVSSSTLNQLLEVSLFNEFIEPMSTVKA